MTNYETYQRVATAVALVGAAGLTLALVAATLWPSVAAAWKALGRRNARRAMLVMAALATFYGGSKGIITFPRTDPEVWYLWDNGSYVTNDAVHVAFSRNPVVPNSANILIEGMDVAFTNQSDWAEHSFLAYSHTLGGVTSPFDMPYPTATNYNWICYTDWTPPPTVHTNGVAYVVWQIGADRPTNMLATIRTGIYTNSVRIAPSPAITNGLRISTALQLQFSNSNLKQETNE